MRFVKHFSFLLFMVFVLFGVFLQDASAKSCTSNTDCESLGRYLCNMVTNVCEEAPGVIGDSCVTDLGCPSVGSKCVNKICTKVGTAKELDNCSNTDACIPGLICKSICPNKSTSPLVCLSTSKKYDKSSCGLVCKTDNDCKGKSDLKIMECADCKCVEGYCTNSEIPKEIKGVVNTAFGSGNVTCGNRTFTCTRGGWFSGVSDQCYCCGQCVPDDLLTVGNTVLKWLFGIVGAIGLAMFVYGGIKWITSAGAGGEVTAGKKAMTNAIIGLVIMFSAGAVVKWLQESLITDTSVHVNITNEGANYSTSSTNTGASATEVHGTTKMGESCLYNQSTKSSYCADGLYCYSIDQTKGVCLPQNPEKSVGPGGECYILPGDGTKDMCKSGTCQSTDKTAGTKGTCPTVEDNPSVTIGDTCKTDAECASKSLFTVSASCYKKSGSSTGKCIPASGRNLDRGESCYVLPGTGTNDCLTGLLCVQNPDASDPKLNRTTGELGICYNYKNQNRGYACTKSFECASVDSCLSVPKAANKSYCLKTGTTFNDAEGAVCESITLADGTSDVDSCAAGLTCMEVEGTMRCSR